MSPGRVNGTCHLDDEEWVQYRERADRMESVVMEIKTQNADLVKYCSHLKKLDALDDIKSHLMAAATGRTQLDIGIAKLVFWSLAAVIVTLLFIIAYLITGQSLGWLKLPISHAETTAHCTQNGSEN
jgi:hypothetical protein